MYPITENLKYIHIPQNKENYNEIMKIAFRYHHNDGESETEFS